MDNRAFKVIFSGKILADARPDEVRTQLAHIFNLNPIDTNHRPKLNKLFSGRPVVIKQGISKAVAEKYQRTLSEVGALCVIKPMSIRLAEGAPDGLDRRENQRRMLADRRQVRRNSSILPDRRKGKERRRINADLSSPDDN